jgi:NTE family protein
MLSELRRRARSPLRWFSPAARRVARHRRHLIDGGPVLAALDPASKVDPDWPRLLQLRDLGRLAAEVWLQGRGAATGRHPAPARAAADLDLPPIAGRA